MPSTESAKKRHRQNLRRRARNRAAKSRLRTQIKAFWAAANSGDADRAQAEYRKCVALLDRTARKGIIHEGNAARNKSRLAAVLNRLAPTSAADTSPAEPTPVSDDSPAEPTPEA